MAEYKIPKKVKYRKQQRGRRSGLAKRGTTIAFGEYALKATRGGLDYGQADRGGPRRDHALRQARRQALDSHLPR